MNSSINTHYLSAKRLIMLAEEEELTQMEAVVAQLCGALSGEFKFVEMSDLDHKNATIRLIPTPKGMQQIMIIRRRNSSTPTTRPSDS
jgi:hypothetical protein